MTEKEAIRELYLIWNSLEIECHPQADRIDELLTVVKNRMRELLETERKYKELCK